MNKTEQWEARATFMFKDDLLDRPCVLTTHKAQDNGADVYVTVLEDLPVLTFRAGSWRREVADVNTEFDKAVEKHESMVEEYNKVK